MVPIETLRLKRNAENEESGVYLASVMKINQRLYVFLFVKSRRSFTRVFFLFFISCFGCHAIKPNSDMYTGHQHPKSPNHRRIDQTGHRRVLLLRPPSAERCQQHSEAGIRNPRIWGKRHHRQVLRKRPRRWTSRVDRREDERLSVRRCRPLENAPALFEQGRKTASGRTASAPAIFNRESVHSWKHDVRPAEFHSSGLLRLPAVIVPSSGPVAEQDFVYASQRF